MKKAFHSIFALVLAGIAATGCTDEVQLGNAFLDKAPGGTLNIDSIFNNPDYVNQFLTNIYNQQYYGLPYGSSKPMTQAASPYNGKLDALTDLYQMHWTSQKVWTSYYTGTFSAKEDPLISFSNDKVWETVHQVSLIKENIEKVPNMSDKQKKYIVAQAKALQAFAYSILLPHYGGLPIIDHTISDAGEKVNDEYGERRVGERCTFEQTVNAIVKWCDEAAPDLYWAYNGNDAESSSIQTGRWTKAGVMALKAQVLWLAASPLYNSNEAYMGGASEAEKNNLVWYGNYDASRWQRALEAFEDFWRENENNGGYYHLYQADGKTLDAYRLAYRRGYIYDDSPENIHWTKVAGIFGTQGAYSWLAWNWQENGVKRLIHGPTVEYVEMFPWSDGKPFNRETDMKYQETYEVDKDKSKWDVYTCLKNNKYDRLFYQYEEIRGGFKKTYSRDPRLYENATVSGTLENLALKSADGKATGNIMEVWVGGQHASNCVKDPKDNTLTELLTSYCPTGFGAYKYVMNRVEWWRDPNMHWNVLTIPDMILMYAECLAECGRNQDAIDQVDLIRKRVGMKSIASSYNSSLDLKNNKENLIEEILRERACELGMTNARYIDMIRRKRTDWMVKPLHGMATYRMIKNAKNQWVRRNAPYFGDDKNSGMTEPARFEYEFFELTQGKRVLWGQDPKSPSVMKWLMMPFPQDEINKGYGLIQNPGW